MKKFLTVILAISAISQASPDHTLVIPDAKDYISVEGLETSGHGSNAELVSIMEHLLTVTHPDYHVGEYEKNHMVGWYVTEGASITIAEADRLRIDPHNKSECVVLCLELPEAAQSFQISFTSIGNKFGYSVWDYHANYEDPTTPGAIHCRLNENSYSHKGSTEPVVLSFNAHDHGLNGDESGDDILISGDYIFIMWNATPSEKLIDINGVHASYVDEEGNVVIFSAVPEPATSAFSLAALAALATRRRRR